MEEPNGGEIPTLPEGEFMSDYWQHDDTNESGDGANLEDASESVSPSVNTCRDKRTPNYKPPDERPMKQVRTQPLPTNNNEKGDRTYSKLWAHFSKVNGNRAKCLHCEKNYAADPKLHGTGGLWNHLDRCQKTPWNKKKELPKSQRGILDMCANEQDGSSSLVGIRKKGLDIASLRDAFTKMTIVDGLAFNFVEGEGFNEFIRLLEPRWTLPSRITVAADCFKLYEKEKAKLKYLLRDQRLCLTTDGWTSIQNLNYLVLTAHYIDDSWRLKKKILNFRLIENHKGETIGKLVETCLTEWGFAKILTMTVDNAGSNSTAIDYLKQGNWKDEVLTNKYLHVRCAAHITNLIVKEGLKEQSQTILKIRLAMKFVRSSPQRKKLFQECVMLEKIECKKGVCLDVETRWNSTYLMLETAIKYKNAFNRLRREDESYRSYFTHSHNEDLLLNGPPSRDDWEKAEAFVKFLGLFYDATLAFSGSNFVTSSSFFRQIVMMYLTIRKLQGSNDLVVSRMADNMKAKFDKYWINTSVKNNMVIMGIVFDPRYKFKYLNFAYKKIHGEDVIGGLNEVGKKMVDTIKVELEILFKDYMGRYASNETTVRSNIGERDANWEETDCEFQMELDRDELMENKCELTQYLNETCEKIGHGSFDILGWWKSNSTRFPTLSKLARDVLAIPVSTVASEQAFSTGGRILNEYRSSLNPKTAEMLVCAQNWLKAKDEPIDIKAMTEEIEKYEEIAHEMESKLVEN